MSLKVLAPWRKQIKNMYARNSFNTYGNRGGYYIVSVREGPGGVCTTEIPWAWPPTLQIAVSPDLDAYSGTRKQTFFHVDTWLKSDGWYLL